MSDESLLQPEERVLSTLDADGSRRWLTPKLSKGRWWQRRRVVAYALIVFFLALPWLRLPGGKPIVLLDVLHREFHLFGFTFLPTDTVLLAIFVLICFVLVFLITAIMGRAFCGWACPHSVYLEFVYRPLERLFLGKAGTGGKYTREVAAWRKIAMYVLFFLISLHLANTFVAYFVGTDNLTRWIWTTPPWQHPFALGVVVLCTVWIMWDMCFWREQLCIIGCPYGRFQSVMLDRHSMIVSYDPTRGEPRGKPTRTGKDTASDAGDLSLPVLGDCVDCTMCVQVCPTGIDIRDGLQMECINCTQCIDACDSVMDKLGRARGLIRYSSQAGIDRESLKWLRPRVLLYPLVLVVLVVLFFVVLFNKPSTDLGVLRGMGRPFVVMATGQVENQLRIKMVNRTQEPRTYQLAVVPAAGGDPLQLIRSGSGPIAVEPGQMHTEAVRLLVDPAAYNVGRLDAVVRVTDDRGVTVTQGVLLRGPARVAAPGTPNQKGSTDEQ